MLNKNNLLIKTFSSVDFALLVISAVAVTSIIGTIIPQGKSLEFYAQQYGSRPAIILELLDITNMYASYWFQGLLILLCISLVICTWVRLPSVLAVIRKDNLAASAESIVRDSTAATLVSTLPYDSSSIPTISTALAPLSLKMAEEPGKQCLFLHEKGAWSRMGAYLVHASILLIICGALIGKFLGYDAFVMVTEGTAVSSVHQEGDGHQEIPLGFEVFCRSFKTDYYPNGTPKEYRSELTILEAGDTVLRKSITVNDPLKYKGMTFFQSSYQAMENEYTLIVTKTSSSGDTIDRLNKTLYLKPSSEHNAEDIGLTFKILATSDDGHGHGPYKLQITDGSASLTRVMNDHEPISIKKDHGIYTFSLAQRFATGLKVVKDPGVWIVYIGCALMLLGLYVSFFMSHVRIWIVYRQKKDGSNIAVLGKTNKNSIKMEQLREKIVTALLHEETLALRRV